MNEKFFKSKQHFVILGICAISIVLIIIYAINWLGSRQYEYAKPYSETETLQTVDLTKFNDIDPSLEIGLNSNNYPVFKDPNAALTYLKKEYADSLELVQKEFKYDELTNNNYSLYMKNAKKVSSGIGQTKTRASFISEFLEIYKNSFKE